MRSRVEEFMRLLKNKMLDLGFSNKKKKNYSKINLKRAREYMVGYLVGLGTCVSEENKSVLVDLKATTVADNRIERMKRSFKIHRSTFDFNCLFCKVTLLFRREGKSNIKQKKAVK